MFDSLFNLIIILIPLAIFIGRIVVQARNKHQPPPKAPQPYIPVHFEDDDDNNEDNYEYFKKLAAQDPKPAAQEGKTSSLLAPKAEEPSPPAGKPSPVSVKNAAPKAPSGQKDFSFKLAHLSALKQAVVMAEILGPPKGIRD